MSANILYLYFATNRTKKLFIFNLRNWFEMLLYYSSVLYCTSVEVQEVDVISTVLIQIYVKAHRTMFL